MPTLSRARKSWQDMIKRCHNKSCKDYAHYGGRGISVCAMWQNSFATFLEDMGEPGEGMTLDRYPNADGNYEPGNCRWATRKQQGWSVAGDRNGTRIHPERIKRGDAHYTRATPELKRIGQDHPMARLSSGDVVRLRAMRASGAKLDELARKFGITFQHAGAIASRKSWRHV